MKRQFIWSALYFPAGLVFLAALASLTWGADAEPMGPSSRRTPLVISEIMYHPAARADGRKTPFVEIYNSQPWFYDISGFRISGDIEFVFPPRTILDGLSFLVVGKAPADLMAAYSITNVVGPYTGDLPKDSGTVRLEHRSGGVLLEVRYSQEPPWPVSADGAGHSLVLACPTFGERNVQAWAPSQFKGGSPGVEDAPDPSPARAIVINEVFAGAAAQASFIELYNRGSEPVDVSGCILTDDPVLARYPIPPGVILDSGTARAFFEAQLGFPISSSGQRLFFLSSDRSAVYDSIKTGARAAGVSLGRFPIGHGSMRALARSTPGEPGAELTAPGVVINEIMFDPISGDSEDEYIELLNCGSADADLSGWRFVDGIEFEFPARTVLHPGGYLVVAKNANRLRGSYSNLTAANLVGDFKGSLANGGERVALARPQGSGYELMDEVAYGTGGRWDPWAHGGGSSLELIDPRSDRQTAANWTASDETRKAPWVPIEFTGPVANFAGAIPSTFGTINSLHVLLMDAGECLLDNVEVLADGVNLVTNSDFENGLEGWVGQGTHSRISVESAEDNRGASLRFSATGRGDPGPNRLFTQLSKPLTRGQTVTIRARARWLRGSPELLLRLVGNYAEAYGRLIVPGALGTPGAPNTGQRLNLGPSITDVRHGPVLPAANEAVLVTAHLHDPDGLSKAVLRYRVDPSTNYLEAPMLDDGTGGDRIRHDGVFSATIPGHGAGALVAFSIEASDQAPAPGVSTFPNDAPARECLIRFGDPAVHSQFGIYRLWMTRKTMDRWRQREVTSNDPLDITFVYGDVRVIYNAGAYYAGSKFSPNYDSPMGRPCDYTLLFPDDDRFLGATDFRISWPGNLNAGPDETLQSEQAAFWVAEQLGVPFNNRRYVICYANGVRRNSLLEDAQRPNGDYLEQWFPKNPDGDLYKIQVHYETDQLARSFWSMRRAGLLPVQIPDTADRVTHYRWNWAKRAVNGSANEYRSLFELIDTANLADDQNYAQRMEALVDVDQWMRVLAAEHIVGNWDSFGYADGSNMYFYKPHNGKWRLCIWDMDMPMGGFADPPGTSIFAQTGALFPNLVSDRNTQRFFSHPPFRRAYLRALQEAVDGPLLRVGAMIDAKTAAFATNQIRVNSSAGSIKNYLALRRTAISNQLARLSAPFALSTPAQIASSTPSVELSGTAPFQAESIRVNGAKYPIRWTSVTNWSLQVPLTATATQLTLAAVDQTGQPMEGGSFTVTVTYTGAEPLPPVRLLINEWMAANTKTLADPADGDFDDWFELYNPGSAAVDLSGWRLTDNPSSPAKFVIPTGFAIPAGGFLLVWADEEGSQNSLGTDLHVNFKLSKSGETIGLIAPDGTWVDSVRFGAQADDLSEGRLPDGSSSIQPLPEPTPGRPNQATAETEFRCRIFSSGADEMRVEWEAIPGRAYEVQHQMECGRGDWLSLGRVTASAPTASIVWGKEPAGRRFFRVVSVE